MTLSKIQVTVSDVDTVLKTWEEAYETDLSQTIVILKQVQESINDYLTQLVNEGKCDASKDQSDDSNVEDEDDDELEVEGVESDIISGFIKNMGIAGGNSKRSKKQKGKYSKDAKKFKN